MKQVTAHGQRLPPDGQTRTPDFAEGVSFNGRTDGFEPENEGSIPSMPVQRIQ